MPVILTSLDTFYSFGSVSEWRAILGPGLHYHNGRFDVPCSLEAGVQRTVRALYPYVERGSRVLDLGCGWGGPGHMLVHERACRVTGVTISSAQAEYCRSIGLHVVLSDVEQADIPEMESPFDVVFALESFSHISDKRALLRRLRPLARRLILSVNCAADGAESVARTFGNTMHLCSPRELQAMLADTGWRIVAVENRRAIAMPTLVHWKHNLETLFPERPDGHFGVLWDFTTAALRRPSAWAAANPLMDVIAEW